jgi:FixJ family two-component response regulator
MSESTVFIIDDDPSARRGITRLVQAAGFKAEPFSSAADFLASGKWSDPGCILLDVRMPDMTGPELQEKLYSEDFEFHLPIIFLSAHGDVPTTAKAMKMGAVDFLTKPVELDELKAAIQLSLEKDATNRSFHAESSAVQTRLNTLTKRETEVMKYVITGILNKQIAAELKISEETVKIHRGRVMQKLGIVSVVELVRICEIAGISPAELPEGNKYFKHHSN